MMRKFFITHPNGQRTEALAFNKLDAVWIAANHYKLPNGSHVSCISEDEINRVEFFRCEKIVTYSVKRIPNPTKNDSSSEDS